MISSWGRRLRTAALGFGAATRGGRPRWGDCVDRRPDFGARSKRPRRARGGAPRDSGPGPRHGGGFDVGEDPDRGLWNARRAPPGLRRRVLALRHPRRSCCRVRAANRVRGDGACGRGELGGHDSPGAAPVAGTHTRDRLADGPAPRVPRARHFAPAVPAGSGGVARAALGAMGERPTSGGRRDRHRRHRHPRDRSWQRSTSWFVEQDDGGLR